MTSKKLRTLELLTTHIHKLHEVKLLNGYKLASMDFKNMYGNIPPKKYVSLVQDLLCNTVSKLNPVIAHEIV